MAIEITSQSVPTPKECDPSSHFIIETAQGEVMVGMDVILQCLRLSECEGDIPPLPKEWWYPLIQRYQIEMNFDENI